MDEYDKLHYRTFINSGIGFFFSPKLLEDYEVAHARMSWWEGGMRSWPSLIYYPGICVCVCVCVYVCVCVGMRNDKWDLRVAESWPQFATNTNRVTEHLTVTFDRDIKNRGRGCRLASTDSWHSSLLFWRIALGGSLLFWRIVLGGLTFILTHRVVFFCTQTYENMPSNCNIVSHSATCLDMT